MALEIKGIIPPILTAMRDDESLDPQAQRALVNRIINGGCHGIFSGGSQGEFFTMTADEREKVTETIVDEARGRVPVFHGSGAITTAETIKMVRRAKQLGAAGVHVITPWYVKVNQRELLAHYLAVADASELPILLYNLPGITGVNIDPATVAELAKHPNIAGMKDSGGNMGQSAEYILVTKGQDFAVLTGIDLLIAPTMLLGGKGAVAAMANLVPEIISGIYNAMVAGDYAKAAELQLKIVPLRKVFMLGSMPSPMKEAVRLAGLNVGPARKPDLPLSDQAREEIKKVLVQLGILPAPIGAA